MKLGLKIGSVAVTAAMALAAAGCGGSASDAGTDAGSASSSLKGKKVGFQFCTESNAWCAAYIKTLTDRLEAEGVDVTTLTSEFNQADDSQHVSQLIAQKPDVLVVGPSDPNGSVPGILRAKAAKIPVVSVVSQLPEAAEPGITVEVLAGTDDLGRIAAETLVEGLKKAGHDSGNIIAITGPAAQGIVTLTRAAFEKELAKSPEYKLVATEDGSWDPAKTQKITQQLLAKNASSGGVQGIWAQADYMASGSIQAVKQAGEKLGVDSKGIIISSSNCSPAGLAQIKAGEQYGTGTEGPADEANAAADAIIKLLKGEDQEKTQITKESTVTAENLDTVGKACDY